MSAEKKLGREHFGTELLRLSPPPICELSMIGGVKDEEEEEDEEIYHQLFRAKQLFTLFQSQSILVEIHSIIVEIRCCRLSRC